MAKKDTAVRTEATRVLFNNNTPYAVHQYRSDRDIDRSVRCMSVDDFDDPARVFLTDVTKVEGALVITVAPITSTVDDLLVAAAIGGATAEPVTDEEATAATGFPAEAMSPLGVRNRMPVLVDISALDYKTIYISAGTPGFALELSPTDLIELTKARTAPITRG